MMKQLGIIALSIVGITLAIFFPRAIWVIYEKPDDIGYAAPIIVMGVLVFLAGIIIKKLIKRPK